MLKVIANFISTVLHPVFFPIFALLFVSWADANKFAGLDDLARKKLFAIVALNTIAFPVITVFIMHRLGFVKNIVLKDREERIIPFIAGGLFYFWTFMVVRSLAVSEFITQMFLGFSLTVFACFFLTLFYKVSVHSAAAGGFIAIALYLTFTASHNLEIPLMLIIIAAGLLGSSRWFLKEHSPAEIFSGYMVGFLLQIAAYTFY